MTILPLEGSFVEGLKPLTKEEYIEIMKKKGFHFENKEQKYWIVMKITTKCPKCGREYEETGSDAENTIRSVAICSTCGFEGDLGL